MFSGLAPFTLVHVLISLVGIATGFGVLFAMMGGRRVDGLTAVFLTTTVLTSATGFFLPAPHFLPSHAIGILSLVVLAIAILARYSRHMEGGWRKTYVITASIAQYFNCFVLVVQLFLKVPALHELGSDGNRAAVRDCTRLAAGVVHRPYNSRGEQVPRTRAPRHRRSRIIFRGARLSVQPSASADGVPDVELKFAAAR